VKDQRRSGTEGSKTDVFGQDYLNPKSSAAAPSLERAGTRAHSLPWLMELKPSCSGISGAKPSFATCCSLPATSAQQEYCCVLCHGPRQQPWDLPFSDTNLTSQPHTPPRPQKPQTTKKGYFIPNRTHFGGQASPGGSRGRGAPGSGPRGFIRRHPEPRGCEERRKRGREERRESRAWKGWGRRSGCAGMREGKAGREEEGRRREEGENGNRTEERGRDRRGSGGGVPFGRRGGAKRGREGKGVREIRGIRAEGRVEGGTGGEAERRGKGGKGRERRVMGAGGRKGGGGRRRESRTCGARTEPTPNGGRGDSRGLNNLGPAPRSRAARRGGAGTGPGVPVRLLARCRLRPGGRGAGLSRAGGAGRDRDGDRDRRGRREPLRAGRRGRAGGGGDFLLLAETGRGAGTAVPAPAPPKPRRSPPCQGIFFFPAPVSVTVCDSSCSGGTVSLWGCNDLPGAEHRRKEGENSPDLAVEPLSSVLKAQQCPASLAG
ncbi:hypothetical protein DV515_00019446, partial [Chloebia gouldiae]